MLVAYKKAYDISRKGSNHSSDANERLAHLKNVFHERNSLITLVVRLSFHLERCTKTLLLCTRSSTIIWEGLGEEAPATIIFINSEKLEKCLSNKLKRFTQKKIYTAADKESVFPF